MTRLKFLLVISVAASGYSSPFLLYLLPTLSYWLFLISLICWIPLSFLSLSALFRRNRKAVAIFSATWALAVLPLLDPEPVGRFRFWLLVQGFRVHASPLENYLPRCQLTEFVEKGTKQAVGDCESSGLSYASVSYVVFYDTTGELALPLAQRTPEWKDATRYYPAKKVLLESEDRAEHLFGNFYRVGIAIDEFEG